MIVSRLLTFTTSVLVLFTPDAVVAQFGLGNRNRQGGGGGFQEMQELAKRQQAAGAAGGLGDDLDMAKILEDAMNDPAAKEYLEKFGHNFNQAMDTLSKMSPEDIQQQISQAFSALTDDTMLENIMGSREEVLKQLEVTGMVGAEELAKMKADPAYFDEKMKESFSQMQEMFKNPEMANYMTQALTGMNEMFQQGGSLMEELGKIVGEDGDLSDDATIEKARKALLDRNSGAGQNPMLKEMLDSEEMKSILGDAQKFRESVKEGQKVLGLDKLKQEAKVGAGIGEL